MFTTYEHDRHNDKTVIYTTTNEPFMPVRLYYKIYDKHLLIKALRKLKCIGFEDDKHFILSYFKEAKNLDLEVHYQDVPEGLYPVILAEGHIKQESILHLDLRSLRRAVLIIDFLAKYIPPTIAEITHFANSNKLTISTNKQGLEDIMTLDYDQFFAESRVQHIEHDLWLEDIEDEEGIEDLKDLEDIEDLENNEVDTNDEVLNAIGQDLDAFEARIREHELKNYPEIEKIKISYNKGTHSHLINWLTFRAFTKEMIAMQHYKGNANYSSIDVIKDVIKQSVRNDDDLEDDSKEQVQ